MNVSIVVTCFNEEDNIEACVRSLAAQNYQAGSFEVVISDGGSKDQTQKILQELSEEMEKVRWVLEEKKGTAAGRNAGINASQYEHIAFIDADCIAPEAWLSQLVEGYQKAIVKDPDVIAVGGPNIPPENAKPFVKAIGIALDSYMGSFSSVQGRQFEEACYVLSLATVNVLYQKKKLEEVGCFDESLASEGEDADMNYRLRQKGAKFLFLPHAMVWHHFRATPKQWMRNMFRYGKARARLLKRHPGMWALSFILPLGFLLFHSFIFLAPLEPIFYFPLFYYPLVLLLALKQGLKNGQVQLMPHIMCVYVTQHFAYAIGEAYGLLNQKIK